MSDSLSKTADKLRYTGYFLDVAPLPGAERIVGIDVKGVTHTWTEAEANRILGALKQVMQAKTAHKKEEDESPHKS
jgi:hypothetical protein